MSEILKDRYVILRNYDFGESSIIVVSLTRSSGKMRFLAKGARKPSSPFHGKLGTGSVGEAVYYNREERGLQLLKEVSGDTGLDAFETDLERLCIFQAGLEVIDRCTVDLGADEKMYDLLVSFIEVLASCADPWAAFLAFEVRLLAMAGFYPDLDHCGSCKKALVGKGLNVDPSSGIVTCDRCRTGETVPVSVESREILDIMEKEGPAGTAGLALQAEQRRETGKLLHNLLIYHMDGYRLPVAFKILKGVG